MLVERKNTIVINFTERDTPRPAPYEVHDWIFDTLKLEESDIEMIQLNGISRQVYIKCKKQETTDKLLQDFADPDHSSALLREERSYDSHRPGKHRTDASNTLSQTPPNIFATENSTVVTAQTASTTTLPCVVRKFGNGVVSWIRRKDYHLLTVGLATYSSDDRFLVVHARHLQNWGLQIKYVQPRDAGLYECQVSTHPPTSIFIELKVIEASAEIVGAPDLHLKSGSLLRLVCALKHSTEAPVYVFWYHEDRMINYDKERGVAVHNNKTSSTLVIAQAQKVDSGNYTCVPSNARPASITVHVLNGEKPAAMQHGSRSSAPSLTTPFQFATFSSSALVFAVTRLWEFIPFSIIR